VQQRVQPRDAFEVRLRQCAAGQAAAGHLALQVDNGGLDEGFVSRTAGGC